MKESIIYLAGGCFWGTQKFIGDLSGVLSTQCGYILGKTHLPPLAPLTETVTYREVCNHSGHTEGVKVVYDNTILPLLDLLKEFSYTIDPTSYGRQGADIGIQYRTGIYYLTEEEREISADFLTHILQPEYEEAIAIELLPLLQFIPAEEEHQDYLEKNPRGYCHINFSAIDKKRLRFVDPTKYTKPTREALKKNLSPLQFAITQENATEPPFHNLFWETTEVGIYVDITTGEPLFSSRDKFPSSCGWPSFAKAMDPNTLTEYDDISSHMIRTEIRSRGGNAHLGHVFSDGPEELGGLRYCINSGSLHFIPKNNMEKEGYGEFITFL